MSSLNYTTYVAQISNLMPSSAGDASFQIMLPGAIDYAEGRCQRELDLLTTRVTNTAGVLSTASRTTSLSTTSGYILVPEELNVLTPVGAVSSATRNPLRFTSKQFIDSVYTSAVNGNGVPQFAAMLTDSTVLLGPPPDLPYNIEVIGTVRPAALSSANSSTWLTQNLPDLFVAATMVFVSGYMKDFGSQSDNPQMAQSWENQYKTLFASANTEELRKMYRSQGWTPAQPNPVATPPRV